MSSPVTYESIVKYMNSMEFSGMKLGLDRIRSALADYGNPEKGLKIVHVGGTNGKGSVAAMIAKILEKSGKRVGLFTSPHLVDVRERIQVNGEYISKDDFRDVFLEAKEKTSDLTFFEIVTLMAVLYLVKQKVDYAVFEVGLGGTYDATNFEESLLSVITKVSMDHTDLLGDDLQKIAWEKCNIIKHGQTVVTTEANAGVMDTIKETVEKRGANLVVAGESDYETSLKGGFQRQNAGIAVEVARQLGVGEDDIRAGLKEVSWPGRLEFVEKNVLLDCAHNPAGIDAISQYVAGLDHGKLIIVFGVSRNKKYHEMLNLLPPHDVMIFTQSTISRRLPVEEVPKGIECIKIRDPVEALAHAQGLAGENDLILVCGSIFLIADIKTSYQKKSH
ncbi:bifunctional folylpolyglutamate synthase/dihydrofolate synthase [Nanoarchaeota archaeon]